MTLCNLLRCVLFAVILLIHGHMAIASDAVIERFGAGPDGMAPFTPLVAGTSGNLYGAAQLGGQYGQGVVYELSPPTVTVATWTHTALYSFPPSSGIAQPQGALVKGPKGVLYGTATTLGDNPGCAIFQLNPPAAGSTGWTETELYNFSGANGGACAGAMIGGAGGVLYGTLPSGGTTRNGAIFALTPPKSPADSWTMSIIYAFAGCKNATSDMLTGNLVRGPGGVLYGTSAACGRYNQGAVFELIPPSSDAAAWTEKEISSSDYREGIGSVFPNITIDSKGVLYLTTPGFGQYYFASIYSLTPPVSGKSAWTYGNVYTFPTDTVAANPVNAVISGSGGSLYGTRTYGGTNGFGSVFKLTPPATGQTQWSDTSLYSFNGFDGGFVQTSLLTGPGGRLYGVSSAGRASGNGTVFSLTPSSVAKSGWIETTLYAFSGVAGEGPNATLISDSTGALYGTTAAGSADNTSGSAVFKLTPPASGDTDWRYQQLYTFANGTNLGTFPGGGDLGAPQPALILGKDGALYGASPNGEDGIFKLTPPASGTTLWTKTIISNFVGTYVPPPFMSLVQGPDGTFYGANGGVNAATITIFTLSPPNLAGGSWTSTAIFSIPNVTHNSTVFLTLGADGNLYGTVSFLYQSTLGSVFKLTPPAAGQGSTWTQTFLYDFFGGTDGAQPNGPLLIGAGAVLYGTTLFGGNGTANDGRSGDGIVFALSPPASGQGEWTETVLHRFGGGVDGSIPQSILLQGKDGSLYGITSFGGTGVSAGQVPSGNGTVYKLTPPTTSGGAWAHKVLHYFVGGRDGSVPIGGLMLNSDGKLYGTTAAGGGHNGVNLAYPFGANEDPDNPTSLPGSGTVFQIAQ